MTEEEQKKLDEASRALFSAVTQLSLAKVRLDVARQNRSAPPEEVADAARDYRAKEAAVTESLEALIVLQCSMMAGGSE